VYIADASKTLEYNSVGNLIEYSVEDFFADPENDAMTITVTNGNDQVVEVFSSEHGFLLRPLAMGQTTLAIVVTDARGGTLHETLTVKVNSVLAVEEELNSGAKVYPNPVRESANLYLSYEWKGAVKLVVVDATGRQYLAEEVNASETRDIELNVSNLKKGFYILHAASQDKKVAIKLIKE
jgi:hypothetical protein